MSGLIIALSPHVSVFKGYYLSLFLLALSIGLSACGVAESEDPTDQGITIVLLPDTQATESTPKATPTPPVQEGEGKVNYEPTNLKIEQGGVRQAHISWEYPQEIRGEVTFLLERTDSNGNKASFQNLNALDFTDNGVGEGVEYTYSLWAVKNDNEAKHYGPLVKTFTWQTPPGSGNGS